jgi:hypothetical protein
MPGIGRAGNFAALHAAGDALQRDAVLAAAEDAAIVDDELRHAACVDQPLRLLADPAVRAVDQQAVEMQQLGLLGEEQVAVAAIDNAAGSRHAGKPHAARQVEVRHDIGARRQEDRHVAVRRRFQHAAEFAALVVQRAGDDAQLGGVERTAHCHFDRVGIAGDRRLGECGGARGGDSEKAAPVQFPDSLFHALHVSMNCAKGGGRNLHLPERQRLPRLLK